jgi:glycosyltransferase involved in cell wall biosynthesis
MRLGVLATHPIQYHAPLYRALAERLDLEVYFAHKQTAQGQAKAGFGVAFEWDVPLLEGYSSQFLENRAKVPDVSTFWGCSTPEIAGIIARERFDAFLVNGWYNRSLWQAMRACWRTGTPLLVRGDSQLRTPRSLPFRIAKEAFYRAFIPRFDGYLVVGERAREYYKYYGAREEHMYFVPHFIDNAWFRERAADVDPQALRTELDVGPDTALLLFVGKFIQKKRPADILRAGRQLLDRGQAVQVVLVGSGELEADLRDTARELAVPANFAGFKNQSELPYYYAGADLLVLPSDGGETWGLVVNEAMACGLPAVVSDAVGCAPDLIDPGETGEMYPMGDVKALALALERALPSAGSPHVSQALNCKMDVYSLETATEGVIEALSSVSAPAALKPNFSPKWEQKQRP